MSGRGVCVHCPLLQAAYTGIADAELFKVTSEIEAETGLNAGPGEQFSSDVTAQMGDFALRSMNSLFERVIPPLKELAMDVDCDGPHFGTAFGDFCGLEGQLRNTGVSVPEY